MSDDEIHPERLIFGHELPADAGVSHFAARPSARGEPIRSEDAGRLMEAGHLDPNERQNNGPPANSLMSYAGMLDRLTGPPVRLVGYVVPEPRPDARITLTGLVAGSEVDEPDGVVDENYSGEVVNDTFDTPEGEINQSTQEEFRILGGEVSDPTSMVGELFPPASEMTVGAEFCRVWWD